MAHSSHILKSEVGENLEKRASGTSLENREVISEEIVDKMFGDFKEPSRWETWFSLKPHCWWNDFKYWIKKKKQKLTPGFPHYESFDFLSWPSEIVIPRLKMLKDNLHGCPAELADKHKNVEKGCEEWEKIIEKMIWSFENIDKDPPPIKPDNYDSRQKKIKYSDGAISYEPLDKREWDWTPCEEHEKKVREGLDLFSKHYLNLWD